MCDWPSALRVLAVLILFGVAPPVPGSGPDTRSYGPISGTVVDWWGRPVADAEVSLLGGPEDRDPVELQRLTTDSAGSYHIDLWEYLWSPPDGTESREPTIVAIDRHGRVGGTSACRYHARSGPHEVRIRLQEITEYRGRLVDGRGAPIVGAQVRANGWRAGSAWSMCWDYFDFPAQFAKRLVAKTGDQGYFILPDLPVHGHLQASIAAEGFGRASAIFRLAESTTIRMERPGGIDGTLVTANDTGVLDGILLTLTGTRDPLSAEKRHDDFLLYDWPASRASDRGVFRFDNLRPGRCEVHVEMRADLPYAAESVPVVEIKPGQRTAVSLPLVSAVPVHGRFVDKLSGQGIAGVKVRFLVYGSGQTMQYSFLAATDDTGAFTGYVRPGKVGISLGVPDGYAAPATVPREVDEETTWPTIELAPKPPAAPGIKVSGIVLNEKGQPVPAASITVMAREFRYGYRPDALQTDDDGAFSIPFDRRPKSLELLARSDTAASDGFVTVEPTDLEKPISITISTKNVFTLRGRFVDDAGQCVVGARLSLSQLYYAQDRLSRTLRLPFGTADEEGRFAISSLWPNCQYYLNVEHGGYEKQSTGAITATAGEVCDLADIVLVPIRGVVEGRVVDTDDRPVVGAQVFNAGDSPQFLTTRTGTNGDFRLEGFRRGPVYVFARKAGYQFTAVRVDGSATDVVVELPRTDQIRSRELAPQTRLSYDEEKEIARKVLEDLWARQKEDKGILGNAIFSMARIDPDTATAWLEQMEDGRDYYEAILRITLAQCAAADDPADAITLLRPVEGFPAPETLSRLAVRYADTDPAKAVQFLEEAAVRCREMDESNRVYRLADVCLIAMRMGRLDTGKRIVEEAVETAKQIRADDARAGACAHAADVVAFFDVDRALKLLEPLSDEGDREEHLANMAVAAASTDLGRARELLEQVDSRRELREAILRIAYYARPDKPEEIIRFIDEFSQRVRYEGAKTKSEALGWAAVAIARRDPDLAWSLIDQALELCLRPEDVVLEWDEGHQGRQAQAAVLAVQAARIDYPDMVGVVDRVLATRLTTERFSFSAAGAADENLGMLKFLALVDLPTTQSMLHAMEPRIDRMRGAKRWKSWLTVWALADPGQLAERVDRALDGCEGTSGWNRCVRDALDAVDILTVPPQDRLQHLTRRRGGIWTPEEEF